jgi:hypothetical protein
MAEVHSKFGQRTDGQTLDNFRRASSIWCAGEFSNLHISIDICVIFRLYWCDTRFILPGYSGAHLVKWTRVSSCKPVWASLWSLVADEVRGRGGRGATFKGGHFPKPSSSLKPPLSATSLHLSYWNLLPRWYAILLIGGFAYSSLRTE